jgi:IS1 family transposase
MYKILFPIIILVLNLFPTEVIYSQEVVDSQTLPSNSEVVYNLLKQNIAQNKWEEAKTLLEHLKFLLNTSNGRVKLKDLKRLEREVNALLEQNLEHLYVQGLRQMNNFQLTEALMTLKKILYYESGYKDTEELLRKARDIRENLTKTTVTSPTLDNRQTGLRIYKPEKCYNGYTLFAHRTLDLPGVDILFPIYLIDMRGNIIYQWMVDGDTVLARLKPNGNLVYTTGGELREIDPQGNIIWSYPSQIDHSFQCLEDGNFLINRNEYPGRNCEDELPRTEIISPDKKILWQWKGEEYLDELEELIGKKIIRSCKGQWLNNNSCEILKDNLLAKKDKRFRKGNILCCFNALDLISIIDYTTGGIAWAWPSPWSKRIIQASHAPTMLYNGNILIFDNGSGRPWSRVIEINPLTEEIVWEYHAEPKESFYSSTMGNAMRLPNGNTLICEATKNRIFEITPTGEVVWDFISTFNKTAGTEYINQAFRYSPAYVRPLLKQIEKLQKR